VNVVMNLGVPQNMQDFSISWGTVNFSSTLVHGVRWLLYINYLDANSAVTVHRFERQFIKQKQSFPADNSLMQKHTGLETFPLSFSLVLLKIRLRRQIFLISTAFYAGKITRQRTISCSFVVEMWLFSWWW
jgi:hypothetical protein